MHLKPIIKSKHDLCIKVTLYTVSLCTLHYTYYINDNKDLLDLMWFWLEDLRYTVTGQEPGKKGLGLQGSLHHEGNNDHSIWSKQTENVMYQ